jgi:hypothetical protein
LPIKKELVKMNKLGLTLGLLTLVFEFSFAQLPVQLFGGNKGIEYNFLWYKDINKNGKVSLFNFTFFTVDYKDQSKNAYEIYQVATYNFTKNWGLASGGRFTGGQFAPQIAVSYQLETKDLYLNIFPTIQYFSNQQQVGYSLFGLLFYKPKINDTWKMFNQVAFEPLFNAKGHIYSYQQIRVGLEYKELFQFGLGLNLEQIGKNFESRQNFGVFIRKELN